MVASAEWKMLSEPASSKPWTVPPSARRPSAWVNPTRRVSPSGSGVTESGSGPESGDVLAVDEVACAEREAGGDGLLVGRMDVVAGADVERDGHGGVDERRASGAARRGWCPSLQKASGSWRSGRRGRGGRLRSNGRASHGSWWGRGGCRAVV